MQHNKYVENQDVKIYCATNQLTELKFLEPHKKSHGVRGSGKRYYMSFGTKIGHGTYAIRHIPCACYLCTSILEQPRIKGLPSQQQPRYQLIKY